MKRVRPGCDAADMKRAISAADQAVNAVLCQQCELIGRAQALAAGLSEDALRHRLRPDGPWRVVLPGIYLAHNGGLTIGQREMAAALYAGRACVITGSAALRRQGVRLPPSDTVDVLIPATARRLSTNFVHILRTTRMPERVWQANGIRYATAARAAADAARIVLESRDVRALVAGTIQQRKCTVQQLAAELRAGPSQGSQLLRGALDEVIAGVASVAEGDLRKLIKRSGLPQPMYNPSLFVGAEFLASPDVWWQEAGVAGEVDSREWHLSPADWQRTQARHARMSAQGILVLHYAPSRIRSDPAGVVAEIRKALENGRRRGPLPIRAVPAR
jgi:hypothetical protein